MNDSRRVVMIIAGLVAALLLLIVFISVGRNLLSRIGSTNSTATTDSTDHSSLLKTSAGYSVEMVVRGRIVANEDFRSYTITISPSSRVMTIYKGYTDKVLDTKSLGNNEPAYEQLVFALDRANMMSGSELNGAQNDLRGRCASGRLYEFRTLKDGDVQKMLWTSNCDGSSGSLVGSRPTLQGLFTRQIPDFNRMLAGVRL